MIISLELRTCCFEEGLYISYSYDFTCETKRCYILSGKQLCLENEPSNLHDGFIVAIIKDICGIVVWPFSTELLLYLVLLKTQYFILIKCSLWAPNQTRYAHKSSHISSVSVVALLEYTTTL